MSISKIKDIVAGESFVGTVLVSSYSVGTTKRGSEYIRGVCSDKDGNECALIKWSTDDFPQVEGVFSIHVDAKCEVYQGTPQLIIQTLKDVNEKPKILDWKKTVITPQDAMTKLKQLLNESLTDQAFKIFNKFFTLEDFDKGRRLLIEPASLNRHDSGVGGLINHSLKMTQFAQLIIKQHEEYFTSQTKDIFILGCLLHDWGKLITHNNENIDQRVSERSFLEHRYLFMEFILVKHPELLDEIESIYGTRLKDEFISIILQHHGQYEERPHTLLAYLAHIVDNMDTQVTDVFENMGKSQGNTIYVSLGDTRTWVDITPFIEK